jgi:hypothetical protein
MDSDEEIFLTQNKFREGQSSGEDTDAVLNDILDLEAEGSNMTFDLKLDMFSDISDDDLVKHSDRIVMETQRENISVNSKCKEKENARFIEPISDGEREKNSKSRFSTKTELKSKWAVNLFNSWLRNRREKYAYRSDIRTVEGELLTMDSDTLNYSLGAFITEIRKENGDDYRGNTLYEIIIAIQHHLRENGRLITLMDDAEFEGMRNMLDKKMKDLASSGIGMDKKQSEVISMANEDEMWEKNIIGTDTPEKLRDTLLFLLGLNFALRGGTEHYNLRCGENSQLKLGKEKGSGRQYLEYTEDVSKCNPGGIHHRKLKRKQTKAYENLERPERCVVSIYQKYMSLR